MSLVNLLQVDILNNPSAYFDNFQFEITFEVISELEEDIEFKVVYVGSAGGADHDQILESVMVGPVPVGVSKFVLEAPCPKVDLIPSGDIVGLTVMLLSCSYREKEFIRVGYYVNNDYTEEEMRENPPANPDLAKIQRHILAEKPRVTRFAINWDDSVVEPIKQELPSGSKMMEDLDVAGDVVDVSEMDAAMEA